MWKLLYDSARGTSHVRSGQGCQDCAYGSKLDVGGRIVLLAACSDGAGTAEFSEVGARLAAEGVVRAAAAAISAGLPVDEINAERMRQWYEEARSRVVLEAASRNVDARQFACTLLTAVVDRGCSVFAQLGDGVIVIGTDEAYEAVFWPQSGEYANTTNFLTDERFAEHLEFSARVPGPDELALLTDGLQMLALSYANKKVHPPFFLSMFQALRRAADPTELLVPLRDFLNSARVNERTDDDKTLLLATRRVADGDKNAV